MNRFELPAPVILCVCCASMSVSHASEFDAGGASFMKEALPMYEILNFVLYGLPAWLAVFLAAIGLMQKKDKQSDRAEGVDVDTDK